MEWTEQIPKRKSKGLLLQRCWGSYVKECEPHQIYAAFKTPMYLTFAECNIDFILYKLTIKIKSFSYFSLENGVSRIRLL